MADREEGAETRSVSQLISKLQRGESLAERELWERFIHRLVSLARAKLRNTRRRVHDEEDVALEAFNAFFRGVKESRFARLRSRVDLWQILTMLVERKAIEQMRHENARKRGGGANRGESAFEYVDDNGDLLDGICQVQDPTPETVESFTLEIRTQLESLDDEVLIRVAQLRFEGFQNNEIAKQLEISQRAVERKLNLIRKRWEQ